jgi:hypothetical protein
MADVSGITAVRPTRGTVVRKIGYGDTIAAGKTITVVDRLAELSDADASAALAATEGIAITPGVDAGFGLIATGGSVILVGATLTVGTLYIASDTPGGIKPIADAVTGDYITLIGTASTATQLDLAINATGIQVP